MSRFILASNSPRRRELLSVTGYVFDVVPSDADESLPDGIDPESATRILAERNRLVTEFRLIHVSGTEQTPEGPVMRVFAVSQVVADRAARLPGLIIAAEKNARGHSHGKVISNTVLHHHVRHAGCKQPPHGAALQNQSGSSRGGFRRGDRGIRRLRGKPDLGAGQRRYPYRQRQRGVRC